MVYYGLLEFVTVEDYLNYLLREKNSSLIKILAVLRCLDSSHEVVDIGKILQRYKIYYRILNGNICLTTEQLDKSLIAHVFTHFDEVWLFHDSFPSQDLSAISFSTSDGNDFRERVSGDVLKAFQKSGCMVLLADGCGLNYLTGKLTIENDLKALNDARKKVREFEV